MTTPRGKLGAFGESYARSHLGRLGYQVLASNVRTKSGEIDLLAQDGVDLVFVEVRTRRGGRFGTPEESITWRKSRRMVKVAGEYLLTLDSPPLDWRIDVIAIELAPNGSVSRFEHLKNAVGEGGTAP